MENDIVKTKLTDNYTKLLTHLSDILKDESMNIDRIVRTGEIYYEDLLAYIKIYDIINNGV